MRDKESDEQSALNEQLFFTLLKIFGVGVIVMVGYIVIDSHFKRQEYPTLTSADLLTLERVSSFKIERGAALVEFQSGRKHMIGWGQNCNYDDCPTIIQVLSIGDLISKK